MYPRYSILICFLSFFLYGSLFSQEQQVIDSLTNVIKSEVTATSRLKAYIEIVKVELKLKDFILTNQYINEGIALAKKLNDEKSELYLEVYRGKILLHKRDPESIDEALKIYNEILSISKQKKYAAITVLALNDIGFCYYAKQDYNTSISFMLEAYRIYKTLPNKNDVVFPFKLLAGLYHYQKNFKQALYYTQKRLEENEVLNDPFINADSYDMLGILYASNGDKLKGLENFEKSIEQFKKLGYKEPQDRIFFNMGTAYFQLNDFDKALHNYHNSLKLRKELGEQVKVISTMSYIGLTHLNLKKEDSAFYYLDQVFDYFKQKKNIKSLVQQYQKIGEWYFSEGQLSKTLQLYYDALKNAEEVKDTIETANVYRLIADVHSSQDNFEEAINYQQKALKNYTTLQDSSSVATTKNNISELFIKTNEYAQALSYSKQALKQFESFHDNCSISESYLTIGKAYLGLKQLDSAQYYLNNVISETSMCNNSATIASAYIVLGQIYTFKNQENIALIAFEKALNYANALQDRQRIKEATGYLYPIYQQKGQYKKAYETLDLYQANKDSLFNQKNIRNLTQKELEYDFEKQNQEKALLRQQKEATQQRIVDRQQWMIYMAILACLAFIGIAFSFYRNSQNKKKANILLSQQNLEIANQKEELELLDESKSRLYANISHELRTPLTLISSPIQYMLANEKEQLNVNQIAQLKLVERNATQLKSLVNDILDLSKLESNKLELQEEELALIPYLRKTVSNFDSLAQHLGIQYEMILDIPEDSNVLLDRHKVEKIINNLLSNAIKHTPSGGCVKFLASIEKDQLQFQVTDTGYGIPEEDVSYIFDRFFQSKNSHATLQGGTGIGLALAKELTQLMNGELTVTSKLKEGSTFSLILAYKEVAEPTIDNAELEFQEEEESNTKRIQNNTTRDASHKHTVLIVEDHPDMQRFIQQLLAHKYHTFVVNHGKQALKVLNKEAIDLVISDVMMPEMNGYELLQELKNHDSYFNIPVVMLTALNSEDSKLKALTIGVDDYLSKPFSPEELMARVENLLQRYEARKTVANEIAEEAKEVQIEATVANDISTEQEVKLKDAEWLEEVENSIQSELENTEFNIGTLADKFFLSQRQFQRKMKKITGLTPKKFQQEVALQQGRKLLENKTYTSVKAISYTIGMSNVWRFSQLYEQRFGKNPSDYF